MIDLFLRKARIWEGLGRNLEFMLDDAIVWVKLDMRGDGGGLNDLRSGRPRGVRTLLFLFGLSLSLAGPGS